MKSTRDPVLKNVFFYRDYQHFQGGHLTVWQYFQHVKASSGFRPQVYFSKNSVWDESNPWYPQRAKVLQAWKPQEADLLCLGGLDWRELKEDFVRKASTPVINLILHVRHADSKDPRYAFLKNRAIRICNSVQVADALQRTHKVNGPLYSIPNALDSDALPAPLADRQKDIDLLIMGCKEPELARKLNFLMRCHPGLLPKILFKRIVVMRSHVSRKTFLHQLNRAKATLFLPNQREGEGFYRPALEGMALGTLVVCPDAGGNKSFCVSGENCFMPQYSLSGLLHALKQTFRLTDKNKKAMLHQANETTKRHSFDQQRERFFDVLNHLKEIW